MKTFFENEGENFQDFITHNPVYSLLRHAVGVTVCTDEDYEPSPVPLSVSRTQMNAALAEYGIEVVSGYIFDVEEVCREQAILPNFNSNEMDDLFRLAATK
jgi:hypothetical protein